MIFFYIHQIYFFECLRKLFDGMRKKIVYNLQSFTIQSCYEFDQKLNWVENEKKRPDINVSYGLGWKKNSSMEKHCKCQRKFLEFFSFFDKSQQFCKSVKWLIDALLLAPILISHKTKRDTKQYKIGIFLYFYFVRISLKFSFFSFSSSKKSILCWGQ